MRRTDGDRVPPDLRWRLGPHDDENVVAPWQPAWLQRSAASSSSTTTGASAHPGGPGADPAPGASRSPPRRRGGAHRRGGRRSDIITSPRLPESDGGPVSGCGGRPARRTLHAPPRRSDPLPGRRHRRRPKGVGPGRVAQRSAADPRRAVPRRTRRSGAVASSRGVTRGGLPGGTGSGSTWRRSARRGAAAGRRHAVRAWWARLTLRDPVRCHRHPHPPGCDLARPVSGRCHSAWRRRAGNGEGSCELWIDRADVDNLGSRKRGCTVSVGALCKREDQGTPTRARAGNEGDEGVGPDAGRPPPGGIGGGRRRFSSGGSS